MQCCALCLLLEPLTGETLENLAEETIIKSVNSNGSHSDSCSGGSGSGSGSSSNSSVSISIIMVMVVVVIFVTAVVVVAVVIVSVSVSNLVGSLCHAKTESATWAHQPSPESSQQILGTKNLWQE